MSRTCTLLVLVMVVSWGHASHLPWFKNGYQEKNHRQQPDTQRRDRYHHDDQIQEYFDPEDFERSESSDSDYYDDSSDYDDDSDYYDDEDEFSGYYDSDDEDLSPDNVINTLPRDFVPLRDLWNRGGDDKKENKHKYRVLEEEYFGNELNDMDKLEELRQRMAKMQQEMQDMQSLLDKHNIRRKN